MAGIEDNGPTIVGVNWWLTVFSGAFLASRIYAKVTRKIGLWWDDWILIFSWIAFAAEVGITQAGQILGFGKHFFAIDPLNWTTIILYTSIGASVSALATTGARVSFGVTLLRLTTGRLRWFVWFNIITLILTMVPTIVITWVQCTPVEKVWDSSVPGQCWDPSIQINYGIFNVAWTTLVDWALALLPWNLIWGLQLKTSEKIGVSVAMSVGILSGICGVLKAIYLVQLREQDFFFNSIDVTIWTAAETATAIIGCSIPVLRVFVKEKMSTRRYDEEEGSLPLSTIKGQRLESRVEVRKDVQVVVTAAAGHDDNWSDLSFLRDDRNSMQPGAVHTKDYLPR